jgi:hypothetical protein
MRKDDVSSLARELVRAVERPTHDRPAAPGPLVLRLFGRLGEEARRLGFALEQHLRGPWRVRWLATPFALPLGAVRWPVVECGSFSLAMPDEAAARDLAALLNWCGLLAPAW